jgi:hypothetical protein
MGIVLLVATAAILAPISSAFASHHYANYKWHLEKPTPVRFPVCHTVKEPIALRHGYLIYLPHEICR